MVDFDWAGLDFDWTAQDRTGLGWLDRIGLDWIGTRMRVGWTKCVRRACFFLVVGWIG